MNGRENLVFQRRAVSALEKLAMFRGINEQECADVLSICRGVSFQPNETVFREGDSSFSMFVLISGAIEVHTRDAGHLHTLRPGEPFGEMGMICQIPRTATAAAVEESAALRLNKDEFDIFLGKHPRIGYKLMKNITETLSERLLRSRPRHPVHLL